MSEDTAVVRFVRRAAPALAVLAAALICLAAFRYPAAIGAGIDGWPSLAGPLLVLAAGAAVPWFLAPRLAAADPRGLRVGLAFGAAASALFVAAIFAGYLAPLDGAANALLATAEFGGFSLLMILAGLAAGALCGRIRSGLLAALACAMLASLVWVAVLFLTYHLFWGTPQEQRQFVADQVIADFQRSGAADLRAFVTQDNLGAAFFHPLLGLAAGALLGVIGGALGKGINHLARRPHF